MKIVKFKNGMYGIRSYNLLFGYQFYDFKGNLWLSLKLKGKYVGDCERDLKKVEEVFNALTDIGK